jgi:hypothetical protein
LRLLHEVPLQEAHAEVRGHGRADGERGQDKGQPCSGVPARRGHTRPGLHLMRGGRARGHIAPEPCPTLKPQGAPWEPPSGPGAPPLSVVLAMLMRLACVLDPAQPRGGAWCQAGGAQLGRTRRLWERWRALCDADAVASRRQRGAALLDGGKTSSPRVTRDASASAPLLRRRPVIAPGVSHHAGPRGLQAGRGRRATRQPAMAQRDSLGTSRAKGCAHHALSCPRPWSPRMHKSSAGIAPTVTV